MSDDPRRRPPPAPPLPPTVQKEQSKRSPMVSTVKNTPESWFYRPPTQDHLFEPPTGPYFVYGTLMDPKMLADVLRLKEKPKLRPAKIVGYSKKLWGQYPALQEGPQDAQVSGAVYYVQSVAHAKRLAEYETNSYRAKPCLVQYTDGKEPAEEFGHVFMFVGNPRDLQEGEFDLGKWLKRVGRSS
ncbi:poly(A) polymerase pla1 [Fusarium pseudoanthophilum]|uniref:Putative gamma-glutamylcyclotransferase n=1 Tax=Fusarium pseudoanthophilum TaxID=48495 RepID=A0A8H5ULJ7_9HYPO|nr:poly(A) polymerase pla1 [Fusarium pseudoanthophilum]